MVKKILASTIAVLLSFSFVQYSFANEVENTSALEQQIMDTVEQNLFVDENGEIVISSPGVVIDCLGFDNYNNLLLGLEDINTSVESGDMVVTENLTIYTVDDDELYVQGGNINKVETHWWGRKMFYSKNRAEAAANAFHKLSVGSFGVGTA